MPGIDFREIAQRISCEDFARSEGMPIRHGRTVCPFHGTSGSDTNFAMYADGRGHCFVCGRDADVISMAAAYWKVDQLTAAHRLNDQFRLGLSDTVPTEDQKTRWTCRRSERDARITAAREALADAQQELAAAQCGGDADAIRKAEQWLSLKKCEAARGCV